MIKNLHPILVYLIKLTTVGLYFSIINEKNCSYINAMGNWFGFGKNVHHVSHLRNTWWQIAKLIVNCIIVRSYIVVGLTPYRCTTSGNFILRQIGVPITFALFVGGSQNNCRTIATLLGQSLLRNGDSSMSMRITHTVCSEDNNYILVARAQFNL